ncbi:glycosyltransferase [Maribacter sp. MMG018]|uniref:glycosyltransferase n=1 Tax=Maribacter sp. MMG018 TaxID=2822688 RepID=UPI001B367C69|nr:glycosyltransferase [Maribacter sp. MMG018]MBQ4915647.1 glycosyltransferase [Maribacter sp. MMG018]
MEKHQKISIFIYSMDGGGAERVMSYLLPYLKNKGHDVVLVLMNDTMAYSIPEDVPIYYLEKSKGDEPGIFKFLKLPWLAWKYARLLKRLQITHSFSLLTRPCYINIMARWFTNHPYKLMVSERNYPSLQYGYGDAQSKINTFLVKKLYPKADMVISNAKASAEDLVQNFNVAPEKTRVIYNPIDLEKINAITPVTNFFDASYTNLVSVGRLQIVKNQKILIEAVAPFEKVRLYIFGEGELRPELEQQIADLGLENRVFLMGFESNPFQYLKSADFFIFGSIHEGFPNVLLEAMCCGLPILTTNCKSGPDEIMELEHPKTDDIMITDYGILTPVGNVDLLKKGLAYCLEHPAFLDNCRVRVKERIQNFEREPILESYTHHILS